VDLVSRLRHKFQLFIKPAAKVALLMFAVKIPCHILLQHTLPKSTPTDSPIWWSLDFVTPLIGFALFLRGSLRVEEEIAAVEAYQSSAYLQHVKIRNALTKMQNALDVCEHGNFEHKNCEAALRQQIRTTMEAIGTPPREPVLRFPERTETLVEIAEIKKKRADLREMDLQVP
jgi:hypothetical protein